MPLIANLGFNQLVAADDSLSDHALISLAMYGRAESPYFAAIWAPVELFEGDQVPVRKRTFELDWSAQSIGAHREKKRYPMGLGEHTRLFITWAPKGKLLPLKRYDVVVDGVEAAERRVMQGRGFTVAGSFSQASAIATGPATVASGPAPQPAAEGGGGLLFGAAYHLAEIDKLVFSTMHAQGAHAAQIAVAKDSKLKLVRSYTFAERNWPVTNAHHRMRWGSVAKLLMGMRASVESQDFLEAPIADFLPVPLIGPSDGEALGHVADYASTRLLDLLRYQSGWRDDNGYNYFQRVLETVQRLPLQPSDFGTFVKHSKLAFVDEPPATEEIYNNANFIAASEILAERLLGNPANYVELMQNYWSIGGEDLTNLIGPLPATQAQCLLRGEPPIRGVPGGTRGTIAKTPLPTPNASAPWVPRTYQLCADAEFAVGAGYFTASAVMLARILQGMCPDPIAPVKQLLTRQQRIRMLQTNTVSVEADSPDEGDYGIGASSRVVTFADNPDTTKILKGGDVRYAAGRAETAHYVWGPTSAEHHLTIATVITAAEPIDIEARVESLEKLEYWDSDVNLFPEFFGA